MPKAQTLTFTLAIVITFMALPVEAHSLTNGEFSTESLVSEPLFQTPCFGPLIEPNGWRGESNFGPLIEPNGLRCHGSLDPLSDLSMGPIVEPNG